MHGPLRDWLKEHPRATTALVTATYLLAQGAGLVAAGGGQGGNGP